jgi:hypothetical protein
LASPLWYFTCLKYTVQSSHISKKHFRPGGMAVSEWTPSVRVVRENPVVVYSAPGVDTTRRVPYRPPIAVCSRSVDLLF